MTGEIAILEKTLLPLRGQFGQALSGLDLSAERLMRAALDACERNKRLQECPMADIVNAAMTAAWFGLIPDGIQAALVPFRDARMNRMRAQFIPMYRGYVTMAGFSNTAIQAEIVREGDHFEHRLGTDPFIDHRPIGGGQGERPILYAWATARAFDRPPLVAVLTIDRIRAIRDRSPSAKGADSAWKTDFAAMARKSPIRDVARFLPMAGSVRASSPAIAARMESLHEHFATPVSFDSAGLKIAGMAEPEPRGDGPRFAIMRRDREPLACGSIEEWRGKMMMAAERLSDDSLRQFYDLNRDAIAGIAQSHPGDAAAVEAAIKTRLAPEGGENHD